MPDTANPLLSVVRVAARSTARALRLGAAVLDQLAGGGQAERDRSEPSEPDAPHRTARAETRQRAPKDLGDANLAQKVETILFRDLGQAKGDVNINVADGVVFLRGRVKHPEDVNHLEQQAAAIPEVKRVENLLHLPKTPAPTRADVPEPLQKPAGRRTRPHSPDVHIAPIGVNAEIPVPGAEPSPRKLARERKGRPPSPLGSRGPGSGSRSGSGSRKGSGSGSPAPPSGS
jgi:hypothetical protein